MTKIIKCGVVRENEGVKIDVGLMVDPVWDKHPRLFQIWVYMQSVDDVTYESLSVAFGVGVRCMSQHLQKMKELRFSNGEPILVIKTSDGASRRKAEYTVTVSSPRKKRGCKINGISKFSPIHGYNEYKVSNQKIK